MSIPQTSVFGNKMASTLCRRSRNTHLIFVGLLAAIAVSFFVIHSVILGADMGNNRPHRNNSTVEASIQENKEKIERVDDNFEDSELLSDKQDLLTYSYEKRKMAGDKHVGFKSTESPLKMLRIVHLDLKGAPPRMSYLKSLFPLIVAAGANALLVEYEDMFPFDGLLRNVTAKNAYSREEVLQMLSWAAEYGLEVIPLVQTFGHLEFVLKLQEFRHFRELPSFPQEICPSNPDSFRLLVRELIRQVMSLHSKTRWLHIGCDEVYHLAACGRCTRRHMEGRLLFTEHVTRVARFVRSEFPGVTPLVWDDMLRQWSPMDLADSGLGKLVEPVVWVYIEDIARLLPHYVWYMYGRVFQHVWVASAYKGAYGATALVPDLRRHYENNLAWLRVLDSTQGTKFRGIVLTGWARYDHFAVLCELLPVSVPSLVLNLLVVSHPKHQKSQLLRLWTRQLSCPSTFPAVSLDTDPYQWRLGTCSFPGSNLFSAVADYVALQSRVEALYSDLTKKHGWLTPYNVRHNFSSPWRVLEAYSATGASGQRLARELGDFRNSTGHIMTQYFDKFSVEEWLEQKVDYLIEKMTYLERSVQALVARDTWPRRPLV